MSDVSGTTRDLLGQLVTRSDAASMSKLRNLLAHLCFGAETRAGFSRDPFKRVGGRSPYITRGVLDVLRSLKSLTDCDVPLAIIYWTADGIRFVDMGSVRRRPVSGPPRSTGRWRRRADIRPPERP